MPTSNVVDSTYVKLLVTMMTMMHAYAVLTSVLGGKVPLVYVFSLRNKIPQGFCCVGGCSSPFDEYPLLFEGVCLLLLVDTLMLELKSGGQLCFPFQMNLLSSLSCTAWVWNTLLLQVPG